MIEMNQITIRDWEREKCLWKAWNANKMHAYFGGQNWIHTRLNNLCAVTVEICYYLESTIDGEDGLGVGQSGRFGGITGVTVFPSRTRNLRMK